MNICHHWWQHITLPFNQISYFWNVISCFCHYRWTYSQIETHQSLICISNTHHCVLYVHYHTIPWSWILLHSTVKVRSSWNSKPYHPFCWKNVNFLKRQIRKGRSWRNLHLRYRNLRRIKDSNHNVFIFIWFWSLRTFFISWFNVG